MNGPAAKAGSSPASGRPALALGLLALVVVGMTLLFRDGALNMAGYWHAAEYSHGWLIPFISLYLAAIRAPQLAESGVGPAWAGVVAGFVAVAISVFGELSSIYVIVQYAMVLTLWALVLTLVGWRGVAKLWPALVFLLFMVPLPSIIQFPLTDRLQLVSSSLGSGLLRLGGVPVYLEGNVIDLGQYKLQVVEACAGLRYLYPLMSFALLCAVLFRGGRWQKWLLFLSSAPIAIFMNSFRIAVTGVLVNRFGTEAAEGFLHYFEGWVIFTLCLAILFAEMWVLARIAGRRLDDVFDLDLPDARSLAGLRQLAVFSPPLAGLAAVLVVGALFSLGISEREEIVPEHGRLSAFPLALGEWAGQDREMGPQELEELKLTDYLMATYRKSSSPLPVDLYVAWYDSQRKGASIHSPRACLPGGGWRVEEFGQRDIAGAGPEDRLPVNRAVVSMGGQRMLVYYWFMQRGRYLTDEYLAKWYIFWDSLTMRRTDGALVRLITPVPDLVDLEAADERLAGFVKVLEPRLQYYIPGGPVVAEKAAPEKP